MESKCETVEKCTVDNQKGLQEVNKTMLVHDPSPPNVAPVSSQITGLAQGEAFSASAYSMSGTDTRAVSGETPEMREKMQNVYEKHQQERDAIAIASQKELAQKTEDYRSAAEDQAEKIRKELEKQQNRDVEFRKELVDSAIDRQKREIDLAYKLGKKELEHNREVAKETIDSSKRRTEFQVNMATAAGETISHSDITVQEQPKKGFGDTIKDFFG
jgi:hydroxylamine reductase (hybrid-cluster protein)